MKLLLAIAITLPPSAALAEQFAPEQMLDVITKSPSNRDVRVHDLYNYDDEIRSEGPNDEKPGTDNLEGPALAL